MSGRCPVPRQQSLVIRMSPSLRDSGGKTSRKLRMVRGAVPMNDGMLLLAWAIECPWASVMTQAKSFDSRTRVENDVRANDAAASSTTEISRRHRSSNVIPSSMFSSASVEICSNWSIDMNVGGFDDLPPLLPLGLEIFLSIGRRSPNDRESEFRPHLLKIGRIENLVDVPIELVDDCLRNGGTGRDREPARPIEPRYRELAD